MTGGDDLGTASTMDTPEPPERAAALAERLDQLQGRIEDLEFRLRAAEQALRRKPPASFGG